MNRSKSLFGSTRILSLWPTLSTSPILKSYTWSPLVQSAVIRSSALFHPRTPSTLSDVSSSSTLTGLVAIHLRRGDYKRHCPRLAMWGSSYMGMNQFPALPDKFTPDPPYNSDLHNPNPNPNPQSNSTTSPSNADPNPTEQTKESHYILHCLPTIPQIVSRLHTLRSTHSGPTPLTRVYALSNGWGWWLSDLNKALMEDGWEGMTSSVDVGRVLDKEQEYVGMAVDMAIAEKAEVFVGNGVSCFFCFVSLLLPFVFRVSHSSSLLSAFSHLCTFGFSIPILTSRSFQFSSLTSNVVMLRLSKGLDPSSNRFL